MNSDDLVTELAQIRHILDGRLEHDRNRLLVTPEIACPHANLSQPYSVEDVARIAAGCAGETHQDRIIDALRLLAAAENIANPMAPWLDQDSASDDEQAMDVLRRQVSEIIKQATTKAGGIDRVKLCKIACLKAGRVGKSGNLLSDDRVEKLFHEWLADAADSHARWEVFRQLPRNKIERCKKVLKARKDSIAAQRKCDSLAASWQALREKKNAAMSNGRPETEVAELTKKCDEEGALFRASKVAAWDAKRGITRSLDEAYVREVDRKRKKLTKEGRKAESEAFRLKFESGTGNEKRLIHDEAAASALLLGQNEYLGLLSFFRFPPPKDKAAPKPPRPKDEFGKFIPRPRDESGGFKEWSDVDSASEEFSVAELPQGSIERTDDN